MGNIIHRLIEFIVEGHVKQLMNVVTKNDTYSIRKATEKLVQ